MNTLRLRKELLVRESELNRQALALECAQLEAAGRWVEQGYGLARRAGPWLTIALPVALVLWLRRRRSGGAPAAGVLTAWSRWRSWLSLWNRWRGRAG